MHFKYAFLLPIIFLAACATTTTSVGTPDAIQVYVNAGSSQATAVAAISTADYYSHQLTATVEAHNMQATERAWSAQSTEQSAHNTATARVWEATNKACSNCVESQDQNLLLKGKTDDFKTQELREKGVVHASSH